MVAPSARFDPESLVARIIDELQANPEAQTLLLRALLTNEFLGMPARLERVEADVAEMKIDIAALKTDVSGLRTDVSGLRTDVSGLKTDVSGLRTDVSGLKTDVSGLKTDVSGLKTDVSGLKTDVSGLKTDASGLKTDVAVLKGDGLEAKVYRRVRSLISQKFDLRRSQILHSTLQETSQYLFEPVESALDSGSISEAQETRIDSTDIILHAQRKTDRSPVWVAIEVSNDISQNDIERVHESAEALSVVFQQDVMAVVAGYGIRSEDEDRAARTNVHVLLVSENS